MTILFMVLVPVDLGDAALAFAYFALAAYDVLVLMTCVQYWVDRKQE